MCGISVGLFITTILSSTGKRSAEVQPLLCGATDGTEGVCNISAFCSFQESGFPFFQLIEDVKWKIEVLAKEMRKKYENATADYVGITLVVVFIMAEALRWAAGEK